MDFGLGFIIGVFSAMVWWEYVLLVIMFGGFIFSSNSDNPLGVIVGFGLFFFFPWGESGSLFTSFGWSGLLIWLLVYITLGVLTAAFKWYYVSKKVATEATDEFEEFNHSDNYTLEEFVINRVKRTVNYSLFFNWITLWPFVLIMHFFSDTLLDFIMSFKDVLYKFYASISNRNIKNAIKEKQKQKN